MFRRIIAAALCLCILCSMIPLAGSATTDLSMSQKGLDFIKENEGFSRYAQWDYGQYSIGYGTRCDPNDYPNGITEAEAERLLREFVATFDSIINRFAQRYGLTLTQNEFDALVSFTYNLGPGWTSYGTRMINWLKNRNDPMEFVNAMGIYCHAGGSVLPGLVVRRIREAQIFFYGDYSNDFRYSAVILNSNGGYEMDPDVVYYRANNLYGSLPTASCANYYFAGWYNAASGGERVTASSLADVRYRKLYAHWSTKPVLLEPAPTPAPLEPVDYFTDVSRFDWFYESVNKSCKLGMFKGTSVNTFSPSEYMSRGMVATVLYRMAGEPACTTQMPFVDVYYSAYFAPAVRWCYANQIILGKTDTTFGPYDNIKREELAVLIHRYAEFKRLDTTKTYELSGFADSYEVDQFAQQSLGWAVANGIVGGTRTTHGLMLFPQAPATRAEAAKMLVAFSESFKLS